MTTYTTIYKAYTNRGTYIGSAKASTEAFHKRLKRLYPCVEDVSKLPQSWTADSKAPPLGLTYDCLGCYFRGNGRRDDDEKFAAAVRTDHYIPPSCLLYYFEITIVSKGREGYMGVGMTSAQVLLTKLPGWMRESYGYHADDGCTFNGDGRGHPFGPTFTTGDTIGCGYNLVEGKCFFTKNGLNLGKAFDDIPNNILLYPTIGLKTPGEEIRANFGQEEFVYDIEQDLRSLRKNMTMSISEYPISDFGDWQSTLHKLVQSWLLQNSYPSTADAFTRSTRLDCKENLQRVQQRNRIQQLVLSGKISEAIKLTNRLSPNLLQNNPNLMFALKCRQFIELISGADNDFQPHFNYNNNSDSNGLQRIDANGGFQPGTSNNHLSDNGCNGLTDRGDNNANDINKSNTNTNSATNNGSKVEHQPSGSPTSSSLQELMEIDQPLPSVASAANHETNDHRNNAITSDNTTTNSGNNHPIETLQRAPQQPSSKIVIGNGTDHKRLEDLDFDQNEQKFARLIEFGRELSDYLQHLEKLYGKNESNERMLLDAVGLIAFTNPKKSSFGKALDPSEREPISQLLNSSIVKAEMGDSYRPPLEEVMNHLKKLVRLNDSHGRWLVDRYY